MANLVVVAIPSEDDYVWKVSSEKVPHMTILFLGEMPVQNFVAIANFVSHASQRSLTRFGMEVDRRDSLGVDDADVLFFKKNGWSGKNVAEFRSFLLQDSNIRTAYESTEQFPEWIPHLTLGHPETPAKADTRDYPGFSYVGFDKIALWFNDYDGFEYPLDDNMDIAEVAMDNSSVERGRLATTSLLHFGVKGMKWGVRRDRSSRVTVSAKGKKLKTSGGVGRKPSADAKSAAVIGQISKSSGVAALSNAQLQRYNARLNLEINSKNLRSQNRSAPRRFITGLLRKNGEQTISKASQDASAKAIKMMLAAASTA